MSYEFGYKSTEQEVRNVPEPEWTDTWHPISHSRCIDVLNTTMNERKLNVTNRVFSLSKDGTQVYGTLVFGNGDELSQTIIWRNAINKYFSFGICGGTHAWVCSNLMMSGEFVEFRRHTKGMEDDELLRVVTKGIDVITPKIAAMKRWHLNMHNVSLSNQEVQALSYQAILKRIIPKAKIVEFNNLLFNDDNDYDPNNLYSFHGVCTQLMQEQRISGTIEKQRNLYNFVNSKYGRYLEVA